MGSLVLPIADLHVGAAGGLTLPEYQWSKRAEGQRGFWGRVQAESFNKYAEIVSWVHENLGQPDLVISLGEVCEGLNGKEGGVGLTINNPEEQAAVGAALLGMWEGKEYAFEDGSPYHTGLTADFEGAVRQNLREILPSATLHNLVIRDYIAVEERMIQAKHFTRETTVPTGIGTPLYTEWLANVMWYMQAPESPIVPLADLFLSAHVHSYARVGGWIAGREWDAIGVPSLCVGVPHQSTIKYHRRLGYRPVHWGIVPLVIDGRTVTAYPILCTFESARAQVIRCGEVKIEEERKRSRGKAKS